MISPAEKNGLPEHLRELLEEVVRKRDPELLSSVDSLGEVPVSDKLRGKLRDELVADELVETGINEDDSVNRRGRQLEELIGALTRL